MSTFDEFVEAVKEGVKGLAQNTFSDFVDDAKLDANAFIKKFEADLKRWVNLLAEGKLSEQDFSDLVQAKKALAEIHLLRQRGVALTKIERFRSGLVTLIIDTAFDIFL